MKKITVIDYGLGNITSITNMLDKFNNVNVKVSRSPSTILKSDKIILPGVGAFGKAIKNIKTYKLDHVINEFVSSGKSILGICLGMQLFMEKSEEFGINEGLGLIKGCVNKISSRENIILPNIGFYNPISEINKKDSKKWFYFIHSYKCVPEEKNDIKSFIFYNDIKVVSEIKKGNINGCQFHPEKSHKSGFEFYKKFINE